MSDTPLKVFVQIADTVSGGYDMKRYLLVPIVTTTALAVGACGTLPFCEDKTFNLPPIKQPSSPCTLDKAFGRIHPDLLVQVSSFVQDARDRNIPCYYTALAGIQDKMPPGMGDTVIGYCQQHVATMMKASFWKAASATDRMMLIYHELGHCALHQDHHDSEPDIMNSYLLDDGYGDRHWDRLVNKMFERSRE